MVSYLSARSNAFLTQYGVTCKTASGRTHLGPDSVATLFATVSFGTIPIVCGRKNFGHDGLKQSHTTRATNLRYDCTQRYIS
jgi:hypothetical protein